MESHADRGLINRERRERLTRGRIAQGIRNVKGIDASHTDNITGFSSLNLDALQTVVPHNLEDFTASSTCIPIDNRNLSVRRELTASNSTNPNHTHITVVVQGGNLHLKRPVGIHRRCRHMINDHVKQRLHIVSHALRVVTGNAV